MNKNDFDMLINDLIHKAEDIRDAADKFGIFDSNVLNNCNHINRMTFDIIDLACFENGIHLSSKEKEELYSKVSKSVEEYDNEIKKSIINPFINEIKECRKRGELKY